MVVSKSSSYSNRSHLKDYSDLPLIEKQRNRIRELSLILGGRKDQNMDVGKHDMTR